MKMPLAPILTLFLCASALGAADRVSADENAVFAWDGTRYPLPAWNRDLSGGIDQFWQQSSLKVSPREWVDILARIRACEIPFSIFVGREAPRDSLDLYFNNV